MKEVKKSKMYPVEYKGKLWYEKDCGEIFNFNYNMRKVIAKDSSVFIYDDMWVYPDDNILCEDLEFYIKDDFLICDKKGIKEPNKAIKK